MDLLVGESRKDAGRNPSPTYGIIDSQIVPERIRAAKPILPKAKLLSVKTTSASEERGIDGGKK